MFGQFTIHMIFLLQILEFLDKAARFIANCNQKKIPLVFLQDVTWNQGIRT